MLGAPADGHYVFQGSPNEVILSPLANAAVKLKAEDFRLAHPVADATMVFVTRGDLGVRSVVAAQAESFGVRATVAWRPGNAVLVNAPAETAFAREVALELLGAGRVTLQGDELTGSEDFAFMLERVPGSYLLIGNGTAGEGCAHGIGEVAYWGDPQVRRSVSGSARIEHRGAKTPPPR